jgi:glycosyltransferase involved in cell wall biosynthesis
MIAMASYPGDPRIRRQVEALDEAGYEVDVLCRYSGEQPPKEKFGNVTAYRIMNAPPRENKIVYFIQSVLFLILAFFRLVPLSIKRKYKVIQAHNLPDYLVFAGIFHKLFGVKLLLDIHDPSVDLFEEKWPGKKNKALKFLMAKAEKYSCKLSNHLFTVTNMCKERLIERGNPPNKITLILNTANEDFFKFNNERGFRKIKSGYEMSYSNKLERLVNDLELSNNVNLNGRVVREQIPELINNHDVGIVPYLQTDYMNLALPTKAFEYIAMGLPLVSTKLKDLYETFDDNCIKYIDKSDPKQIANAISFLCSNPGVSKNLVESSYRKLSEISGAVMKERFIQIYDDLTSSKPFVNFTSSRSSF